MARRSSTATRSICPRAGTLTSSSSSLPDGFAVSEHVAQGDRGNPQEEGPVGALVRDHRRVGDAAGRPRLAGLPAVRKDARAGESSALTGAGASPTRTEPAIGSELEANKTPTVARARSPSRSAPVGRP